MGIDKIPTGLIPSGRSLIFTEVSIPGALKREHKLATGNWGVLRVIEGSVPLCGPWNRQRAELSLLQTTSPSAPKHRTG